MARYSSPRDEYIRSPRKIGIERLAKKWHGRGRGYSLRTLMRRCSENKWVEERERYQTRARDRADEKAVESMADVLAEVLTPAEIRNVLNASVAVANERTRDGVQDRKLVLEMAGIYARKLEHSGPGGGPMQHEVTALADLSDAELQAIIDQEPEDGASGDDEA